MLTKSRVVALAFICAANLNTPAHAGPDSLEILRSGSHMNGVRQARIEVSVASSLARHCGVTFSETFNGAEAFLAEMGLKSSGDLNEPMLAVQVLGIAIDTGRCALSIEVSFDRQAWLEATRTPANLVRAPIWRTQTLLLSTKDTAASSIADWLHLEARRLRPKVARP